MRGALVPLRTRSFPGGSTLTLARGSVVDFAGDAIVNAANEGGLGGGGIDGLINNLGGRELQVARQALPEIEPGVRIRTGGAVVTIAGGKLRAKYVIHAVGPNYFDCVSHEEGDELLGNAYRAVLNICASKGLKSCATCLLSSGIYRGDRALRDIVRIAVEVVNSRMPEAGLQFWIVGFTVDECAALEMAFDTLQLPSKMDGFLG